MACLKLCCSHSHSRRTKHNNIKVLWEQEFFQLWVCFRHAWKVKNIFLKIKKLEKKNLNLENVDHKRFYFIANACVKQKPINWQSLTFQFRLVLRCCYFRNNIRMYVCIYVYSFCMWISNSIPSMWKLKFGDVVNS